MTPVRFGIEAVVIGIYAEHSPTFLRILAVLTALAFSVPLCLAPLSWARAFRWRVDDRPELALYFGRSLGALALVLSAAGWYAAGHPEVQPFFFRMLIGVAALMVVVHIVGAVQKVQPWTETVEIVFWAGLLLLALMFCPA